MRSRQWAITLLLITIPTLLIAFNNCSPGGSDSSATSDEPQVATEIVGQLMATITYYTPSGKVYGFAMDSGNKSSILRVLFYVNGPAGVGTYVGQTIAKETTPGPYDGHHFIFQLPRELGTGKPNSLFLYANDTSDKNIIYPAPYGVVTYTPKAASYFNQNIAPFIAGRCTSCHDSTWTAEYAYYNPLINPLPTQGGSPTNNRFFRKMAGLDGHRGGAFCDTGTDKGICADIQAWWRLEFQ